MSRRLFVVLMAVMGMVTTVSAAESETENPLEPLDASSPRAAYQSFLEQTKVIEDAAIEYRSERSPDTQAALLEEVAKTGQLSDLSDTPEASRDEIDRSPFDPDPQAQRHPAHSAQQRYRAGQDQQLH